MSDRNPKSTRLPHNPDFDDTFKKKLLTTTQTELYKSTIGSLRYLADSTRPDILFATSRLVRFSHKPTTTHWKPLKHVLGYLKETYNYGILYQLEQPSATLETFSDSGFTSETDLHSQEGAIHTVSKPQSPGIVHDRKQ